MRSLNSRPTVRVFCAVSAAIGTLICCAVLGQPSPAPSIFSNEVIERWTVSEQFYRRLSEENVDADWSAASESKISGQLIGLGLPIRNLQITCGTSICRVEVFLDVQGRDASVDKIREVLIAVVNEDPRMDAVATANWPDISQTLVAPSVDISNDAPSSGLAFIAYLRRERRAMVVPQSSP